VRGLRGGLARARHRAARGFCAGVRAEAARGVVQCVTDDFEACIAHLRFPLRHRRVVRTTDLREWLFLEERRRTKIIPNTFGERPALRLMYAAVIRAAERWRGIAVGEFEQRQLRAIRDELGRAHAERVAPAVTSRRATPVRKTSS
jgi:transposase-like protein